MEPLTLQPRNRNESDRVDHCGYGDDGPEYTEHAPQEEKKENFLVEVFKFAILALIIVVPFRIYIAQPFIVSGASMDPTFETGEYLIVDQVSYRLNPPQRGDVVIFRYPNDPQKYFIKRIIGLPGESIRLADGYTIIIDPVTGAEMLLEEPYLRTDRTDDHLVISLSQNEYFVMGDNRSKSSDSRVWGAVPRENIVGRAFVRLLPPRNFSFYPGAHEFQTALPARSE